MPGSPAVTGSSRSSVSAPPTSPNPSASFERLLDALYAGFVLPDTRTTVLQDWDKGRRSEVDEINGLVVAEAGPDRAPINAAVVELAHRIERGELEPRLENYALLADYLSRTARNSR